MRQRLDPRKVKKNRSYTPKQLAALYGVHIATVRSWIKNEGLPVLDGGKEAIMHWSAIRDWIKARNAAQKWPPAKPGTMPCLTCKAHKQVRAGTLRIAMGNTSKVTLHGECIGCARPIQRFTVRANLATIERDFRLIDAMDSRATFAPIRDSQAPVKDSLRKGINHDESECPK